MEVRSPEKREVQVQILGFHHKHSSAMFLETCDLMFSTLSKLSEAGCVEMAIRFEGINIRGALCNSDVNTLDVKSC